MKITKTQAGVMAFALAVGLSLLAATYRFGDSAHAIGLIKADGGKARHASTLVQGEERYMLIATASVIKPYRGSARVVLEGRPELDYSLSLSRPVVDLGLRHLPQLEDNIIKNLAPGDRIALWVEMQTPELDPVCRMKREDYFDTLEFAGREYVFCSAECKASFMKNPSAYAGMDRPSGRYTLAFYDTVTGARVLNIPINITGKEGMADGGAHHH